SRMLLGVGDRDDAPGLVPKRPPGVTSRRRLVGFSGLKALGAAAAAELHRSCLRIGWERRKSDRKPFAGPLRGSQSHPVEPPTRVTIPRQLPGSRKMKELGARSPLLRRQEAPPRREQDMAKALLRALIRQLSQAVGSLGANDQGDAQLLERFVHK